MRPEGHQIVHDIVLARNGGKDGPHTRSLVGRRDLLETKIYRAIGVSHGTLSFPRLAL
jgi:hypothetical protein